MYLNVSNSTSVLRLNNSDVNEKAAQMASCLKASDFNKALGIVQAAVALGGTSKEVDPRKLYDHLISYYNPSISTQSGWIIISQLSFSLQSQSISPMAPTSTRRGFETFT